MNSSFKLTQEGNAFVGLTAKPGNMKLEYRTYHHTDFDYCNELIQANMQAYFDAAGVTWDRERYQKYLTEEFVRMVWREGQKVGFIHLSERGSYAYLNTIQISASFRNQGIGRKVLRWIEVEFAKTDMRGLQLSVYKSSPALRLYQKLGYEVIADRGSKYLMEKPF